MGEQYSSRPSTNSPLNSSGPSGPSRGEVWAQQPPPWAAGRSSREPAGSLSGRASVVHCDGEVAAEACGVRGVSDQDGRVVAAVDRGDAISDATVALGAHREGLSGIDDHVVAHQAGGHHGDRVARHPAGNDQMPDDDGDTAVLTHANPAVRVENPGCPTRTDTSNYRARADRVSQRKDALEIVSKDCVATRHGGTRRCCGDYQGSSDGDGSSQDRAKIAHDASSQGSAAVRQESADF